MKKTTRWLLLAILTLSSAYIMTSCSSKENPATPPAKPTTEINISFASKTEGQKLMQDNTHYYESMSQNDIDWRMRKENSTLDELKAFAQEQVQDFTEEEKEYIKEHLNIVQNNLNAIGCNLPIYNEIVFIKTTMAEEGGAAAYTIKNQIFIGSTFIQGVMQSIALPEMYYKEIYNKFTQTIAHELFHCITRNSQKFRQDMYDIIGFTVMDKDIEFPENIKSLIIQNPDVEHIDNYAEFTINGQKRQCVLVVLYTQTFSEAYEQYGEEASFLTSNETVLIPLDEPGTKYQTSEVPDFWDKVGKNTEYVIAPEECMADNFSFAVVDGTSKEYKSPKIINDIINTLKSYNNVD